MKTYIISTVLALCVGLVSTASAEVQAVNFKLVGGSIHYTVPNGKVFLLEWHGNELGTGLDTELRMIGAGNAHVISLGSEGFVVYEKALKFTEGSKLAAFGPATAARVIGGLLVDPEDLYAAVIPSEFGEVALLGRQLHATLRQTSPRPSVVRVESSTDLSQWSAEPATSVVSTSDKKERAVTVRAAPTPKFIRARATHRADD